MNIYKCPICSQQLALTDRIWKCCNNHCFDVAKEGYVNLLPVNKKRSKEPGDSKTMLQSRRRFLDQGYYDVLANEISVLLMNQPASGQRILDMGCGEGYYLDRVVNAVAAENEWQFAALDISKSGVQMTAKRLKSHTSSVECAVASAVDTPYLKDSFDAIYSVFAPFSVAEIHRILQPHGRFILVGPGSAHLNELSQLIYQKVQPHEGNTKAIANNEYLQLTSTKSIQKTVNIPREFIPDLLAMTPYFWSTSEDQKQKLFAMKALEVTLDFDVLEYKQNTRKQENNA